MNDFHERIDREGLVAENIREYGYNYEALAFPSPEKAAGFAEERNELLRWISTRGEIGCKGTKVDCRNLSPGCRTCVDGSWSCIFINGSCNCSCFYCPAPQDQTGVPQTNGIPFTNADDYAAYLDILGFTGASLSGGEPLLTLERTLEYLDAIRKRCGGGIHIWLYTNGTLLTDEICRRLRDAGLDEIRFDIGAIRHNLKKVSLAVGTIPTVTVEIPAIPEDLEMMKLKLVEMAEAGVNHLNLHQLRLTPHNFRNLVYRGYTFIHGEKVTVLESELAALHLVRHALEKGLPLPVNYCSFPYKRRFQHAANRRRAASLAAAGWEEFSESGYIRSIFVQGSSSLLEGLGEDLSGAKAPNGLWRMDSDGGKLFFSSRLWPLVKGRADRLSIGYHEAALTGMTSTAGSVRVVVLPSGRRLSAVRQPVAEFSDVTEKDVDAIVSGNDAELSLSLRDQEFIPSGLADYF